MWGTVYDLLFGWLAGETVAPVTPTLYLDKSALYALAPSSASLVPAGADRAAVRPRGPDAADLAPLGADRAHCRSLSAEALALVGG